MNYQLPGEGSPIWETWNMLLNGFGYNWYRADNQSRADDLLVRQKAGYFLGVAASKLQEAETAYQKKYLPPGTREHPFPPPDKVAAHRCLREFRQAVLSMEGVVRSLPVPPTDKIWQRHRQELATLKKLTDADVGLVGVAKMLADEIEKTAVDQWNENETIERLNGVLGEFKSVIEERRTLLLMNDV
ncbi:MAG TPA: hypothetical protein VH280_10420 [Verrucomicrobiae bacterium]|jgi:hypothetical protein|nr:hypothetical protein [Verrucomicrobiae bacterium]